MSATLDHALLAAYYAVLVPLALMGLHRLALLLTLRRLEHRAPPALDEDEADREAPRVTVQLPIYNEPEVAPRLLEAVARLDHPRERLEIQVLDDSTDDTTARLARCVARLRREGFAVEHLRRRHRSGYKAGALDHGLRRARGELLVLFDADFVPDPDFLRRTLPAFRDPSVGMVQARWGHLNRSSSLLTRIQALLLDGHFLIEHAARAASGRLFNFNGTAGIWRRRAIEEAGGWQHDTLTEDLDLSYRAQLAGWRFAFLPSVVVPAELPVDLRALRSQQRRWTRGSAQCLRKLLRPVLSARLPLITRAEAVIHLTSNLSHPLMVGLTLLLFPAMRVRASEGWPLAAVDLAILLAASGSVVAFSLSAARRAGRSALAALALQPALMALGIGMSWHNARAALGGLVRRGGAFERTPKRGVTDAAPTLPSATRAASPGGRPPIGETALSGYLLACLAVALIEGVWLAVPFLALFLCGVSWVTTQTWRELWGARGIDAEDDASSTPAPAHPPSPA